MPPDSVTYMARRASPQARNTPDSAMPSPIGTLAGMMTASSPLATSAASPRACMKLLERKIATEPQQGRQHRVADEADQQQPGGGEAARLPAVSGAERARHARRNGDRQADVDRHQDEESWLA